MGIVEKHLLKLLRKRLEYRAAARRVLDEETAKAIAKAIPDDVREQIVFDIQGTQNGVEDREVQSRTLERLAEVRDQIEKVIDSLVGNKELFRKHEEYFEAVRKLLYPEIDYVVVSEPARGERERAAIFEALGFPATVRAGRVLVPVPRRTDRKARARLRIFLESSGRLRFREAEEEIARRARLKSGVAKAMKLAIQLARTLRNLPVDDRRRVITELAEASEVATDAS